jgi:ABC-type sugar transport system substrate-binding protein
LATFVALAAQGGFPVAAAESPAVTPELERIIEKAFLAKVPGKELDPAILRALSRASLQATPEQEALAIDCWKKGVCKTGEGKLVLGIADGFGDNVWRQFSHMEIILQAMSYPQIGKIIYTNAHGKLEDAITNMRSLVAQHVDLIVGYYDFGDAMLPTMKEAMGMKIPVVAYVGGIIGGKAGEDYLTQVVPDLCVFGTDQARYALKALGDKGGTAALLTGTPGNPQGQAWHGCAEKEYAKHPGWKILKADTQWTQQGAFEAMSGLLAAEKKIDVIHYDYANATRGVVRAFEQAGRPLPLIITYTADNGLASDWERLRSKNPDFKIVYTTSVNFAARVAVTSAIEAKEGQKVPGKIIYPVPFVELKPGVYDPKKPDEYGGSELVPESIIRKMFSPK